MGLTFTVGNATHVFMDPYGSNLQSKLDAEFPVKINRMSDDDDPWYSQELGWSGWEELQKRTAEVLGQDAAPHLLSMPAWKGVYLPVEVQPCTLADVPGDDTPLEIGCLDRLREELEAFGMAAGFPTDNEGLEALAARYLEDDDLIDDDMEIQTYAQLLLAAIFASRHRYPLWIVK